MSKKNNQKKYIEIKTRYGAHLCLIEPDEKNSLIVTAVNLPGVITCGKDLKEAQKMAQEAIEICIECLAEEQLSKNSKIFRKISNEVMV